jgi:hypothetical protein
MTAPFFVDVKRGAPFMRELGYAPAPELMNVRAGADLVLHGYQIPQGKVGKVRQGLSAAGVIFHRPKAFALAGGELKPWEARWIAHVVGAFIDIAGTATARATFYNTLTELQEAESRIHEALFDLDRGLYAAFLALPGVTDHSRQLGLLRLLSRQRQPGVSAYLDERDEAELLRRLLAGLPPPRMLKFFGMLCEARVNNASTRRLILRSILGGRRLELWATRYRSKLRRAITHALGVREAGIAGSILARPNASWTDSERGFLRRRLGRYTSASNLDTAYECVGFILGREANLTLPLLRAYVAAKQDLDAGRDLPFETLEGLRSTFHRDRTSAEVLALTGDRLTAGQELALQRKAESDGVEVAFDPDRYDPVRLYLYAFQRGLDGELDAALDRKAEKTAARFPIRFERVGILIDASASMAGHATQPLRPMAVALALRDVMERACPRATVRYCGGREEGRLVRPGGDTALAEALVSLLAESPEAVFVISDGYENAPAGRLAEVVDRLHRLGDATPIYQFSPVFAAEAGGLRSLSPGDVPAVPVGDPAGLGLALLRGMLYSEPQKVIETLFRLALPEGKT